MLLYLLKKRKEITFTQKFPRKNNMNARWSRSEKKEKTDKQVKIQNIEKHCVK